MLKVAVLVSGGGTNLQAIIDGIENGSITNAKIDVVISNNKNAYALERAKKHDIEAVALSPKDFETRDLFNEALYNELVNRKIDLIVLAGCLVVIPEKIIHEFENRIINIHPSLIPSFCGTGYYGLKVHEKALARGVKVFGATVHFVDEGTDTGPIIYQKAVEVLYRQWKNQSRRRKSYLSINHSDHERKEMKDESFNRRKRWKRTRDRMVCR